MQSVIAAHTHQSLEQFAAVPLLHQLHQVGPDPVAQARSRVRSLTPRGHRRLARPCLDPTMADGGSSGLGWSGMGGAPPRTDAATASRAAGVLRAMASEASPAFYDVRVLVGDRAPFHAHRAVLAAQSSVFRAMFLSGMRETVENEVRLGDVQPAAFAAALRHVYGGSLAGTSRAVLVEVSRFAHRMDMPALDAATTSILLRGMLAPLPDLRKAWQAEVAARSTERPAADLGPAAAPAAAQPPLMTHVAFGGFVPTVQAPTPAVTAVFGVGQGSASGRSGEASVKVLAPRLRLPSPLTYLAAEITKVLDSPELLFFSFELLQRILSSDIVAAPEILLFEKAMGWYCTCSGSAEVEAMYMDDLGVPVTRILN